MSILDCFNHAHYYGWPGANIRIAINFELFVRLGRIGFFCIEDTLE